MLLDRPASPLGLGWELLLSPPPQDHGPVGEGRGLNTAQAPLGSGPIHSLQLACAHVVASSLQYCLLKWRF